MDPSDVEIDSRTNTIYVATLGAHSMGEISVINAARCNASIRTTCAHPSTLHLSTGSPQQIAVDPATDTVYVAIGTAHGHNAIDVFNGASCDATTSTGCNQKPAELSVGDSGGGLGKSSLYIAVNPNPNTLYATNVVWATQDADTVYVLNGATCDAADHAGCGQKPARITVGDDPRAPAIDPTTDTIYVPNHAAGDYAATVSVINGATCNGQDHSGCDQKSAIAPAGFGAINIAIDPATQLVYTTNLDETSVSVINGAACNGTHHAGCRTPPSEDAVGNYPFAITVDPDAGTAYVVNQTNVSLVPIRP